ncbi:MAG: hypothetical protein HXY18_03175 [Bryobacteraceae bacterium]|nr:hypothetical protein [Bryobacteraceae bacterium]
MASTSEGLHGQAVNLLDHRKLRPLIVFGYMQAMDLLSTVAFLLGGVQEANPLVRGAMQVAGNPMFGLVTVKAFGFLLGIYCYRSGRIGLLERANVFFALLLAYNLCCLILGLARR